MGRTGAGKSSLITALFRLAEPMGGLQVDSIQTTELGLHDVRKKISIIPQVRTVHQLCLHYTCNSIFFSVNNYRLIDICMLESILSLKPLLRN